MPNPHSPLNQSGLNRPIPRRSLLMAGGALAALAPVMSACGGSDTATAGTTDTTTKPVDGGSLVWAIETALSSANPHVNGQDKSRPVLRNAFDSYIYRAEDGSYEPWLTTLKLSNDGKTVTLKLREGITFSDGEKFDAKAVVKNFDKLTDSKYVTSAQSPLRFVTKYSAAGADTVQFTLARPDNYFLTWLSTVNAAPLSPKSLALSLDELQAGGTKIAGIGPFTISKYTLNTEIVFTKRKDYAWAPASIAKGQKAAHLDQVTYRTLSEGATRTGALQRGQVDIASDIQPLDVETFTSNPRFKYLRSFVSGTPYSLYLNVSKSPFDDLRVRQAFGQGADITAIVQSIYQGTYDRAWAPITQVGPFADTSLKNWLKFDKDAANKLLDQAGWTGRNSSGIRTKGGRTLTVEAATAKDFVRESRDQLNVALGAALKQNVGIDYKYQPVDMGTDTARAAANKYEVFDNSYGMSDPVVSLDLLYYSSDPRRGYIARGHYNDKKLESWIDTGRFTTDLAARKKAYTDLQRYVTRDKYYVIPLTNTQDTFAYNTSKVHNLTIDSASGQAFGAYTVWVSAR